MKKPQQEEKTTHAGTREAGPLALGAAGRALMALWIIPAGALGSNGITHKLWA